MVLAEGVGVDTALSWAEKFGWPSAFLAIIGFVAWRAWKFMSPYVVKFMDAQLHLIETVGDSSRRSTEATERMGDAMELLNHRHDKHDEQLHAIRARLENK